MTTNNMKEQKLKDQEIEPVLFVPIKQEPKKIYEALNSIMSAIEPIAKNKRNTQQNYNFRGVDDVYAVLNPMLVANKVVITFETLSHQLNQFESKSGGALFRAIVEVKYILVHTEDNSSIEVIIFGEGMDSGDKATPKAYSVAYKYMAFQLFCIPVDTVADVENDHHEVTPTQNKPATPKKPEPEKWLNKADKNGVITPEWANMLKGIEMGTVTSLKQLREFYKVAKKEAEEIEIILKNIQP
jgi:hypothetical protein